MSGSGFSAQFKNDQHIIRHLVQDSVYNSKMARVLFSFWFRICCCPTTRWNAFDNNYNRSAYERICKEFYVNINADWRQKQSDNQGLGRKYNYWTGAGYHPFDKGVEYDKKEYSFTHATTNYIYST